MTKHDGELWDGELWDGELWDVVCAAREGILATIGADGMPHLTNVNFLVDADARVVRLTTTTDRAKGRNLLRDPRASLHAQGQDFYHFAVTSTARSRASPRRAFGSATWS